MHVAFKSAFLSALHTIPVTFWSDNIQVSIFTWNTPTPHGFHLLHIYWLQFFTSVGICLWTGKCICEDHKLLTNHHTHLQILFLFADAFVTRTDTNFSPYLNVFASVELYIFQRIVLSLVWHIFCMPCSNKDMFPKLNIWLFILPNESVNLPTDSRHANSTWSAHESGNNPSCLQKSRRNAFTLYST